MYRSTSPLNHHGAVSAVQGCRFTVLYSVYISNGYFDCIFDCILNSKMDENVDDHHADDPVAHHKYSVTTPREEAISDDPDDPNHPEHGDPEHEPAAYRQIKKHRSSGGDEEDDSISTTDSSEESTSEDSDDVSSSEEDDEGDSSEESSSEHTDSVDTTSRIEEDGDDRDTTTNDYVQNFGNRSNPFSNGQGKGRRSQNGYIAPHDEVKSSGFGGDRQSKGLSPRERLRAAGKGICARRKPSGYHQATVSYDEEDDVIGIFKQKKSLKTKVLDSTRHSGLEEMEMEAMTSEEEPFEEMDRLSSLKAMKLRKRKFRHVSDHSNTVDSDHGATADSDHSQHREDSHSL